jgi:hypothetical protein
MSLNGDLANVLCEKDAERVESDTALKSQHNGVVLLPIPGDAFHDPLVSTSLCYLEGMN